jgi:hypothetical protein
LNKRGSLTDPIVGGIMIVIAIVTIFTMIIFWNEFKDQMSIQVQDSIANETIQQDMMDLTEYYSWFDWAILLVLVALMLASLISAFFSGASYIYSVVAIVLWAVTVLISYIFKDIFINFASYFPTVASNYPMIALIMNNIIIINLFWIALISVVMFSQNRKSPQVNQSMAKFYG